jgi:hypothetical protein
MCSGATAVPLLLTPVESKHASTGHIVPDQEYKQYKTDHDHPPEWIYY